MTRLVSLALAYVFVALAIIGAFLPILPTVPFLLLAAGFAAKGSERLHHWIYNHPKYGKIIIDWEQEGAIARGSKYLSATMLCVSWTILYYRSYDTWILTVVALVFVAVSTYVFTRPEPAQVCKDQAQAMVKK
jgi:uncharacterized membrane protein YbaN (DUF454 family)